MVRNNWSSMLRTHWTLKCRDDMPCGAAVAFGIRRVRNAGISGPKPLR